MDLLEPFLCLGLLIGCLSGLAAAYGLHLLFPTRDLGVVQALVVAAGGIIGLVMDCVGKESK